MPRFAYTTRDDNGQVTTGAMDAASLDEVADRLAAKDLTPVSVEELNFDGSRKDQSFWSKLNDEMVKRQKNVPYKSVVFFTRQLATMLDAGVPLAHSLKQLGESEGVVFRRILHEVADDIAMGSTFSDAIAKHPGAFGSMYVSVVRSGEITGALDQVLDQIATYMEGVEAMRQKVKGAMRYPMFIGGFITILVIGILWKLVPTFEQIYGSLGGKLPLPTRILIAASDIVQTQLIWVLLTMILLVVGFVFGMMNERFRTAFDTYILSFPVFGPVLRKNILAVFCRTMALLMESGTPILQAIEIGGAVVNNKLYASGLERVRDKLQTGQLLSQALRETGLFPVLVTQLVATGEESGRVDALLRKAAEFYEREIRVVVDSLASIIEPFLIIILGVVVGGIMIALYLPIFKIGELIGGA
jgi:type IV pilus assembly protein PilC